MILKYYYVEVDQAEQKKEGMDLKGEGGRKRKKKNFHCDPNGEVLNTSK